METINRRCSLRRGVSFCLAGLAITGTAMEVGARGGNKLITAEEWMTRWMAIDKAPGGLLQVSRFKQPIYFLTKPIKWTPNANQQQFAAVDVPVGFVTDFASIPRVFWSLLPTDGEYAYAAVIHDYLYWTQTRPRDFSDQIFKLVMQDFKIRPLTIEVIYRAVRLGGGSAWSQNAKLRASGERRILKVFPTDPTTSWNDWKRRPEFFDSMTDLRLKCFVV
jgi:hypothetical protein